MIIKTLKLGFNDLMNIKDCMGSFIKYFLWLWQERDKTTFLPQFISRYYRRINDPIELEQLAPLTPPPSPRDSLEAININNLRDNQMIGVYDAIYNNTKYDYKHLIMYCGWIMILYSVAILSALIFNIGYPHDFSIHVTNFYSIFTKLMTLYMFSNAKILSLLGFISGIIFMIVYVFLERIPLFQFSFVYPIKQLTIGAQCIILIGMIVITLLYIWSIIISIKKREIRIIASFVPIFYIIMIAIFETKTFHLHHSILGYIVCFMVQTTSPIGEIAHSFMVMFWISGVAIYGTTDHIWTPT